MLNWLQRYWLALVLSALMVAMLDGVISSLITCHPVGANTGGGGNAQQNQECTALAGPLLLSLIAVVDFLDNHGEAVTGIFTIVLAVFTGRLWYSTEKLWGVTTQSVELARNEFAASHRPKMRLKHIWLTPAFNWRLGEPLEVNLDIVNIGNTEGLITWINFETILVPAHHRLPQRPPYDEVPPGPVFAGVYPDTRTSRFLNNAIVRPGLTYPREVCDGRALNPVEIQQVLHGQSRLYLIGTIEYFDVIRDVRNPDGRIIGGLRQTAFGRRLTFISYPPTPGDFGRFDKQNDPDYEFEEWEN